MSQFPLGRLVRPAVLLVAGMLLGHGAASVAAPAAPLATAQTRIESCGGLNFDPINIDTVYEWSGREMRRGTFDSGDGWFLCDAQLPHRAVVTKVRFTIRDVSDVAEVRYCALVRSSLAVADALPTAMSEVPTTGVTRKPGTVRLTDTTILNATIDNGKFGYWLQCQLNFPTSTASNGVAIIGADVTYRISAANG